MANKAMAEAMTPDFGPEKSVGDIPLERRCLRCVAAFWSEGFGERICRRCKGLNAWKNAVATGSVASRRR